MASTSHDCETIATSNLRSTSAPLVDVHADRALRRAAKADGADASLARSAASRARSNAARRRAIASLVRGSGVARRARVRGLVSWSQGHVCGASSQSDAGTLRRQTRGFIVVEVAVSTTIWRGASLALLLLPRSGARPSTRGRTSSCPEEVFDADYYYCHVEPELIFAKKCGPGRARRTTGAATSARRSAAWRSSIIRRSTAAGATIRSTPRRRRGAAQSDFQAVSLEMSRDYMTAPLFVRPSNGLNHPRVVFSPNDRGREHASEHVGVASEASGRRARAGARLRGSCVRGSRPTPSGAPARSRAGRGGARGVRAGRRRLRRAPHRARRQLPRDLRRAPRRDVRARRAAGRGLLAPRAPARRAHRVRARRRGAAVRGAPRAKRARPRVPGSSRRRRSKARAAASRWSAASSASRSSAVACSASGTSRRARRSCCTRR